MFDKARFAEKMIARRKLYGFTVEKLALEIDVDRKTLGQWENPRSNSMPRDIFVLDRWCETLGLSLGEALDDRPPLDEDIISDPVHIKAFRVWYARYTREKPFARLIHRITRWDSQMLTLINELLDRVEKTAENEDPLIKAAKLEAAELAKKEAEGEGPQP